MRAYVIYPTYRTAYDIDGKERSFVYLWGRLENGESFLSISAFRPYFWIRKADLNKVEGINGFDREELGFSNFEGEAMVKIVLDVPRQVPELRQHFESRGVQCYEADIRFPYRFMMDMGIRGSCDVEGNFEQGKYVDRIYRDPVFSEAEWFPQLRVLSIDIETTKDATELLSLSMHTDNFSHVYILSDKPLTNATNFSSEKDVLVAFKDKVKELDPDIITGWNLVGFDFKVLQDLFRKHGVDFILGREDKPCIIKITEDFFRESTADFPGRQVLDGIALLKNSFIKLEDYRLGTAAREFLGQDKLIGELDKLQQIEKAFKDDTQLFVDYNLKDSVLALDILRVSGALDLTIQRSLLTGMPLERVSASIASLDSLYLRELGKRKIVAPSLQGQRDERQTKGGFVMTSKPGIYTNILVHDFKSLYPSLIRTFNIDPASYLGFNATGDGVVKLVNGACFRNDAGILPSIIQRLWERRDIAKKEKNKRASYAIKILMNSFYGVLANPNCRFYNSEIANAITHTGQQLIKLSADRVRAAGYDVIYGDTDSIFTNSQATTIEEATVIGEKIQADMNAFYKTYIREGYDRHSYMELQFEKVFLKFMMPTVRNSEVGAKKRYAGILLRDGKEKLEFTGLEFVRSDWTQLAKKFQLELLERIFRESEVTLYIRKFVEDLRSGQYDGLLVYRKSIRKGLAGYTKTTPPHVKAARMLEAAGKKLESTVIRYVMTENGPQPLELQKSRIDYEHYIEKQVKPIADSVLSFYGTKFDDVIKGSKQKTLFGFT